MYFGQNPSSTMLNQAAVTCRVTFDGGWRWKADCEQGASLTAVLFDGLYGPSEAVFFGIRGENGVRVRAENPWNRQQVSHFSRQGLHSARNNFHVSLFRFEPRTSCSAGIVEGLGQRLLLKRDLQTHFATHVCQLSIRERKGLF
ncbi:hypothetical protein CLAIMM_07329, partial [Cladophialophora immunda]